MIPELIEDIKLLLNTKQYFDVDQRWAKGHDFAGERIYREGTRKRDLIVLYIIDWFIVLFVVALFLSPFIILLLAILKVLK
ncbi:MAG: hypothetical protein H0U76_22330 [Ktedonobacteraceae bacterium]|nr:hypothetical protein [Ktedonobacteraceae bacterium]